MADDVVLNSGSGGDTIGADDIAGVKYQRVKLILGANNTNDGDVASGNPLPVTGTVAVTNAGITTIAGAVSGSEMQVDVVTSALPSGASTAAKQPALGTAGTASTDVISVQGIASMTPLQVGDNSSSLTVDNGGTFVTQENGAALTALQLIDDPVATLGTTTYTETSTKGMIVGAVRRDADTTLVDTTNEVGPLQMDANGRLKVEAFSGETLPVSLTSTTVTGTVAVTQSGTWDEVGINDSGNSITVDAPVGTPVFVRLSDGSAAIATLPVSLASVPSHAVTNAGTFAVQVDGSALTALQLIDNTIFADDAAFTIGTSSVSMAGATVDEASTDSADEGDAVAIRATANRQLIATVRPNANGEGLDIFRSLDLDETEEDIKTAAGKLYGWFMYNAAASVRYVKFYNATAANVTVGSTTPVLTIPLPATSGANVEFTNGIPFSTAISAAATTGVADADTGAPSANDVVVNVFYK